MSLDEKRNAIIARMGAELRQFREELGLSQRDIADRFEWERDAISKVETGKTALSAANYCLMIDILREAVPADHPGLAFADHYLPTARRRR